MRCKHRLFQKSLYTCKNKCRKCKVTQKSHSHYHICLLSSTHTNAVKMVLSLEAQVFMVEHTFLYGGDYTEVCRNVSCISVTITIQCTRKLASLGKLDQLLTCWDLQGMSVNRAQRTGHLWSHNSKPEKVHSQTVTQAGISYMNTVSA